jgi:hypothetical protein
MTLATAPLASAGVTLEKRVAQLEAAVADLQAELAATPDPSVPLNLFVNCAAGDTISAALSAAHASFAPVTIDVSGVCNERVLIDRDDVTIQGVSSGAGVDGSGLPGTAALFTVASAHRVIVRNLVLTPDGLTGLRLETGATVTASHLEIEKAGQGIAMLEDSSLAIDNSVVVHSSAVGVANQAGALIMHGTVVAKGASAGVTTSAGYLRMFDCKVYGNALWGVSVASSGAGVLNQTAIVDNAVGLFLRSGASVLVGSGTAIENNTYEGIRVWESSTTLLGVGSTIAKNGANGVTVLGGSVLAPLQTTISKNGQHGIEVRDTSLVTATSGAFPEIQGNAGWGVRCESFPGDARLATPGFPATAVFGNAAGQLSCPGFMVP